MTESYIETVLPTELVYKILRQVQDDRNSQWVRLEPSHNPDYFLVCTTRPAPLIHVSRNTRRAMIACNLTLSLRARNAQGPVLLTSFNYTKDTLYLDLGIQSLCDITPLNWLSSAVSQKQIRCIRKLAICLYPARLPERFQNSAQEFISGLDSFESLRNLNIVLKPLCVDSYAEVLSEIVQELGEPTSMTEENLSEDIEPALAGWLQQVEDYTNHRHITMTTGHTEDV